MMKTKIIETMAIAVRDAEDKDDVIAPLEAMTSLLNEMYTEGAKEAMSKKDHSLTFSKIDSDLFIVNLGLHAIFMRAWYESKSFEELTEKMYELMMKLKADIDGQNEAHRAKHRSEELEA